MVRRRRSGLTLIEVITALAILLVGVSVTVASIKTATKLSKNQRYLSGAIAVAESQLEALLLRYPGSPDLATGAHGPVYYDDQCSPADEDAGARFEVDWLIVEHDSIEGLIDLSVSVAWNEDKQRRFLSLETVREGNP